MRCYSHTIGNTAFGGTGAGSRLEEGTRQVGSSGSEEELEGVVELELGKMRSRRRLGRME